MPIFRKVERAQSIIQDGKERFLKACSKCSAEFYGEKKIRGVKLVENERAGQME
jgi:hypothetical protein